MPKQSKSQKTHAAVQRASNARKIAAGWRRRGVWVPPGGEDLFRAAMAAVQKKYKKGALLD